MNAKHFTALLLTAALAACASTPRVYTDHAPTANFSQYSTYTWSADLQGMSPLAQQRVVEMIDAQLAAKGWRKVTDNGDVTVVARASTQQKQDIDTYYDAPMWGGWGYRSPWMYSGMGMGYSSTSVRTYEEGTLVVDMFDTASKQAIWRGTATGTIPENPQKLTEQVQAGISEMFAGFPPQ